MASKRCIDCRKKATRVDPAMFYKASVVHYCDACATAHTKKTGRITRTISEHEAKVREWMSTHVVRA